MTTPIRLPFILPLACVLLVIASPLTHAQIVDAESPGPSPTKPPPRTGPNGGTLRVHAEIHLETTVDDGGIKIFVTAPDGSPLSIENARGSASLQASGEAKRFRYDLLPAAKGILTAPVNLTRLSGRQIDLEVQLIAMPPPSSRIRFRETLGIPPSEAQRTASAIARQKTCPVTGKRLGSMGPPVQVSVGNLTVYVCCKGCSQSVLSNPAKYTPSTLKIEIAASSPNDAKQIQRQAKCPVMDEPLGSMGQPVKVTVGGQPVFLCCEGCIKKLKSDPAMYLARVYPTTQASNPVAKDQQLVASAGEEVRPGVFKAGPADKSFYTTQKTCPVMGEPLEAMGGPFRVTANGKAIYICCPGCAKKIAAEPNKYLAQLQSKGISPPAVQP